MKRNRKQRVPQINHFSASIVEPVACHGTVGAFPKVESSTNQSLFGIICGIRGFEGGTGEIIRRVECG